MADRGYHWIAQMPDGKFAILYADPVLKTIHHEKGVFPDYPSAVAYAKKERLRIDERHGQRRDASPAAEKYASLGREIASKLDELFALHPSGITVQTAMAHFGTSYELTLAAIRWLAARGMAQWGYRGEGVRKFLFPNSAGQVLGRAHLSANQDKILRVLASHAGTDGVVVMSYREISIQTRPSINTVQPSLVALRQKGYLHILTSGDRRGIRTSYRVTLKPEPSSEEKPVTFADFAGKSDEEVDRLRRKMYAELGLGEADVYSPEEADARMVAAIRGAFKGAAHATKKAPSEEGALQHAEETEATTSKTKPR